MAHPYDRTPHLIGRERELSALRGFVARSAVDGAALLLSGEPGVGKSALLHAAAELAAADGIRVISGEGVEYETDVSFAALHQLVDALADDLRRLPPSSQAALRAALGDGSDSAPVPDRLTVMSASLALLA